MTWESRWCVGGYYKVGGSGSKEKSQNFRKSNFLLYSEIEYNNKKYPA